MKQTQILITLLIALLLFVGCEEDKKENQSDCGCNSPTLFTIPSNEYQVPFEEQTSGLLYFKTAEHIDMYYKNDNYNNHFWILQGTKDCYNCKRHFIICNEALLGNAFEYLKSTGDSLPVTFYGNVKQRCGEPFIAPADYYYGIIKLNSLSKQ